MPSATLFRRRQYAQRQADSHRDDHRHHHQRHRVYGVVPQTHKTDEQQPDYRNGEQPPAAGGERQQRQPQRHRGPRQPVQYVFYGVQRVGYAVPHGVEEPSAAPNHPVHRVVYRLRRRLAEGSFERHAPAAGGWDLGRGYGSGEVHARAPEGEAYERDERHERDAAAPDVPARDFGQGYAAAVPGDRFGLPLFSLRHVSPPARASPCRRAARPFGFRPADRRPRPLRRWDGPRPPPLG